MGINSLVDRNIIKSIILAETVVTENSDGVGKAHLTARGEKYIVDYCKTVDNPEENKDLIAITYNLEKMGVLGWLLGRKWNGDEDKNIEQAAYVAEKRGYAHVKLGFFKQIKWDIMKKTFDTKMSKMIEASSERKALLMNCPIENGQLIEG